MSAFAFALRLLPRVPGYWLARAGLCKPPLPILLNFSVTNHCQSRCTTCNIWKHYIDFPERADTELRLDEIERIFSTLDPVLLLNICGGEPTLRDDLPQICALAARYLKPSIIHFPTNCIEPERVECIVRGVLEHIPTTTHLTVKMSLDGIGAKHDEIRGVEGNFDAVCQTHDRLARVRDSHPNFYLDAGTTLGNDNVDLVKEIGVWVNEHFRLDNFLHEIADLRGELFNTDLQIRPSGETYTKALSYLKSETARNMKGKRFLSRMTQALRLVYYHRAGKRLCTGKRGCFCYAGITNAHINPWGGVWICNVQAFDHEMGNLRDFNYDFRALWHSPGANEVRTWVREAHCACPLVGQAFLDTVLSPGEMLRTFWYFVRESR